MLLLNDFSTSVRKALDEIDPKWEDYQGMIICGTHSPQDWEDQIRQLNKARLEGLPTLGICFGFQLMAIEYARNVLGNTAATSEEFNEGGDFIVYKLDHLNVGLHGGESYWNNYGVKREFHEQMVKYLFKPSYVGVQYHPEYQSSKDNPHWVLVNFINTCKMYSAE